MNDLFFQVHYLVRDIKSPNNQSWFPQFFPRIFLAVEKENELFIGPKQVFLSLPVEKETLINIGKIKL